VIEETTVDGRFCVSIETELAAYERVWLGLRGHHQIDNVVVAIQLAESLRGKGFSIPHSSICDGIIGATHPGRLELIQHRPAFLLDGAHNPAGALALREYLDNFGPHPLTLVFGAMRDKQLSQVAEILFPVADQIVLSPVNNPRTATLAQLREIALKHASASQITEASSSTDALDTAISRTLPAGMICVTGSLYLIGETRPAILKKDKDEVA
jgi:dihydrofolate synthase/folylpolyglutamate synthase